MNGKERVALAMRGQKADRTPLMCQISYGFLAAHIAEDPMRFWYEPDGLADAFIQAADKYHFDGILVNKSTVTPGQLDKLVSLEDIGNGEKMAIWSDGRKARILPNTDPVDMTPNRVDTRPETIDELDVEAIRPPKEGEQPEYSCNVLKAVLKARSKEMSIHGEIISNFSSFLYGFRNMECGLMALLDDPEKAKEAIERLNQVSIFQAREQCKLGIDALKLSCAWAGAGLISRGMYEEFVLPTKKTLIDLVHREFNIPVYIHTCGAIGDRLDLMAETGADGLECLDPPPIGTCDLAQASEILGGKCFIKGNLDSVNEMRNCTPEQVLETARKRLEIGKQHKGGYILASACSVAPDVPEENLMILHKAVEQYG